MESRAIASQVVVDRIRRSILDGRLLPGTRLDEVSLGAELGVSRNTLREAFRLLADDQLVIHHPHRGVFVRTVDRTEAHEIYAVRRMLQTGALRDACLLPDSPSQDEITALERTVVGAEEARAADDWELVGTLNGDFHQALTRLGRNRLVDAFLETLMTHMRLFFLTAGTPARVHERYVDENRRLFELVAAGLLPRAAVALELYLVQAEDHILGL